MQVSIHFQVSTDMLPHYADAYLAQLWHVSQANPAPFSDTTACRFAELVSREIVRRWLAQTPPDLWRAGPSAVGLNLAVRWSDADYNQAYYGLTPVQAAATGLRVTTPGAGISAVQAGISGRMELAPRWTGFGGLAWQRLAGDAADSPLVRERTSPRLVLGAAYSF